MASTLGVLDVLSRLREESERASTALAAQEVRPPVSIEQVLTMDGEPWGCTLVNRTLLGRGALPGNAVCMPRIVLSFA